MELKSLSIGSPPAQPNLLPYIATHAGPVEESTVLVAHGCASAFAHLIGELRRIGGTNIVVSDPTQTRGFAARSLDRRHHDAFSNAKMIYLDMIPLAEPRSAVPRDASSPVPPPRGGLAPGALRRVCEQLERQLDRKWSLNDLATIAGLSTCHFARAFRQSIGESPHRYLMRRRIVCASNLIRETDRTLADIALAMGFSDQSHFTRLFARHIGEAPRVYRRRHR